jgi:hypothetical protein
LEAGLPTGLFFVGSGGAERRVDPADKFRSRELMDRRRLTNEIISPPR